MPDVLLLTSAALAIVTVAAVVFAALTTHLFTLHNGCGWDGRIYCNMAQGLPAPDPYSHRVLYPLILRVLSGGSLARIVAIARVLTPLTVLVGAILSGVLTVRIGRSVGLAGPRLNAVAVASACVVTLSPFALHFSLAYPVYTDALAITLGLGWLLATTSSAARVRWLSPLLALLAALTREEFVVFIGIAALVQLVALRPFDRRLVAGATVLACAVGGFIAFTAPSHGDARGWPYLAYVVHIVFQHFFGSAHGRQSLVLLVIRGAGLIALLAVLSVPRLWRVARGRPGAIALLLPVAFIVVLSLLALGSGINIDRFLADILPFALPPILVGAALAPRYDLTTAICLAGTVALWPAFTVLNGGVDQMLQLFSADVAPSGLFHAELTTDLAIVAIGAVLGIGAWLLAVLVGRAGPPTPVPRGVG